jgi:hypothetical protein
MEADPPVEFQGQTDWFPWTEKKQAPDVLGLARRMKQRGTRGWGGMPAREVRGSAKFYREGIAGEAESSRIASREHRLLQRRKEEKYGGQ